MIEARTWSQADTARFVRVPSAEDDKYSRGVVALRTGSGAYPGAAVLGVEAAWRAGAGFVRFFGDGRAADAVLARRPETVVGAIAGAGAGARVDAWVIGSGTDAAARSSTDAQELARIVAGRTAVVIDAGALDLAAAATAPFVITPHAGELARMQSALGLPARERREDAVVEMARTVGGAVLLKGSRTLIADPDGALIAVEESTSWLATAGTGDVLAGAIGAVIAADPQADPAAAAAAGAWLHGRAGRIAAGVGAGPAGRPIVALDVADALPLAIADVLG
ncbi:ADP-dependent NAD(P)H-hydrate dehydratase [Microbacterium sp.]|uniref:ADP-dependent NAD(P)H-hydrate dehydratase n=1 Tax=Microbacterium sp. TaxID=51671 RepID=UPI0039E66691